MTWVGAPSGPEEAVMVTKEVAVDQGVQITHSGYISAKFEPGEWVGGDCYEFDPVDTPNGTCEEKTRSASRFFPPASSRPANAQRTANGKRKRDGSNGQSAAQTSDEDVEDKATTQRRDDGKRKRDGSNGQSAAQSTDEDAEDKATAQRRDGGKRKRGGASGQSAAKTKDHDAKDKATAQRVIRKLVEGIKCVMKEDVGPPTPEKSDDSLTQCDYKQHGADDGGALENMLWNRAADAETLGRESAWVDKHLFSVCRWYRRVMKMEITVDSDVSVQAQKKRWEVGGQVLNEVVNGLYAFRKELALVVYSAARKKSVLFSGCADISAKRRAAVVRAIVDGLRFTPITVPLASRVMLPPAYLCSVWGLEYSEVCNSLELGGLAGLKVTRSDLAQSESGVSLSFFVREGDDRIIENTGVRLLTTNTGCEVLSAGERHQAATPLSPRSSPAGPVNSKCGSRTDQAPSPRTRSFQPINRRDGTTMSDAASEPCDSRRVSVTPERSPLKPVFDVAGLGHESPSAPVVPSLGPTERTSSRGSRPDEFGVGDVPSSDGQGRPWDERGRRTIGISPPPVEGVVRWEIGSVEQRSGNGPPDASGRLTLPGTGAPPDSEPGAGSIQAGPPCDGQDSFAATGTSWGDLTTLATQEPSLVRAISVVPPLDPGPTTSFQSIDCRDGPTMSMHVAKRPKAGAGAASELCQSTQGGVSAAPEGTPLNVLAEVAGWGHAEGPFVVPTLGPTERTSSYRGSPPNESRVWGVPGMFDGQGYPDASGLLALPDESCERAQAGTAPVGLSPHEIGLMIDLASPRLNTGSGQQTVSFSDNSPAFVESPFGMVLEATDDAVEGHSSLQSDSLDKRQRADREADGLCHGNPGRISAAEHAAGQDDGQDKDEEIGGDSAQGETVDLLMHEFLCLDSEDSEDSE